MAREEQSRIRQEQEREAQFSRILDETSWAEPREIFESDADRAQSDWKARYDRANQNDPYGGINPDNDPFGF